MRVIEKLAVVLCVFGFLFFGADEDAHADQSPVQGGTSIGGIVGYDTDASEPFGGVDLRFDMPASPTLLVAINPAVQYYFISAGDLGLDSFHTLQFDTNILLKYPLEDAAMTLFAGAGVAVLHTRASSGALSDSNTEVGFNPIVAGMEVDVDPSVSLLAQIRATRISVEGQSFTSFSLMGGVLFGF